jgi:homoserine trans-succinylase
MGIKKEQTRKVDNVNIQVERLWEDNPSQKAEKRCLFFPEFHMPYFRVCLSSRVSRDAEYYDVLQTSKEYFTDESKSTPPTFDRLRRIIYG